MQHQRGTILFRQATELFIQYRPLFLLFKGCLGTVCCPCPTERRRRLEPAFQPASRTLTRGFGPQANPPGNAVQPTAKGLSPSDCLGFAAEHQEGGLEGVLGIRQMTQETPAGIQDHRSMPAKQTLKGRLVSLRNEALQE